MYGVLRAAENLLWYRGRALPRLPMCLLKQPYKVVNPAVCCMLLAVLCAAGGGVDGQAPPGTHG